MKKAITVFKKFRGFFLAFFLVALAFLAVGLGTLGSVYSAGGAYELEVRHESDRNQPAVIFYVPSSSPKVVDVYLNVAIIYAEEGTPATVTLQRSTSNPSPFSTGKLTWSATKFSATLENFFTPAPELGEDGKPVKDYKEPDETDVFYRFIAPFSSSSSWNNTSTYRHWGLSVTGANILVNEVVFIGENDEGERIVIPNVEVRYAAYGQDEKPEEARLRAEALLDAQPKSVPSLAPTAYSRFTASEIPTLMTISEMRRGNVYATDEDPETPSAVDVYHADRVYGALGNDLIALGAAVFGMSPFGLRFMPMLAAFGALIVLSRFTARLLHSEKAGFVFSLLFAAGTVTLSLAHVGTPLMIGIFFFACALDLVHRFYAKGIKKASLFSALPLLFAGLFGAAAICVNGAFVIPTVGVVVLFVLGLVRMKKAKEYQLEKIIAEPEPGTLPAPNVLAETAEGEEPVIETREMRAAKVISEHRFKRLSVSLLFTAGLIVGAFLLSLIGMLPMYYAYLKVYDNPASPVLNVFALSWRTFANGFTGVNAYAGDTTWNFFHTLFRSEASFADPAGTTFSVLGFCVNPVAILAAAAGIVYAVVRLVLLLTKKADAKEVRIALRRTLIPLVGLCLSIIAAACARTGLVFILLAWLFAFVLAANFFGGTYEGKTAKIMKAVNIVGVVLLAAMFGLLLVFSLGIPLPAAILAKIFG